MATPRRSAMALLEKPAATIVMMTSSVLVVPSPVEIASGTQSEWVRCGGRLEGAFGEEARERTGDGRRRGYGSAGSSGARGVTKRVESAGGSGSRFLRITGRERACPGVRQGGRDFTAIANRRAMTGLTVTTDRARKWKICAYRLFQKYTRPQPVSGSLCNARVRNSFHGENRRFQERERARVGG
jgi:hypothetical protein